VKGDQQQAPTVVLTTPRIARSTPSASSTRHESECPAPSPTPSSFPVVGSGHRRRSDGRQAGRELAVRGPQRRRHRSRSGGPTARSRRRSASSRRSRRKAGAAPTPDRHVRGVRRPQQIHHHPGLRHHRGARRLARPRRRARDERELRPPRRATREARRSLTSLARATPRSGWPEIPYPSGYGIPGPPGHRRPLSSDRRRLGTLAELLLAALIDRLLPEVRRLRNAGRRR
jgi:hypothetical protein